MGFLRWVMALICTTQRSAFAAQSVSSIDFCPNRDTPDMHCSQKGRRILGVSRSNAAPLLQLKNGVLDQMPKPVEVFVILSLYFPILFGRNHDLHIQVQRQINNFVSVISFVPKQIVSAYSLNKFDSLSTIRCGTCCNKHSDWITMRIHGQMYL